MTPALRTGLDIGGTKTEGVVIGADGTITARVRRATGYGTDAVIASATAVAEELAAATGRTVVGLGGLGVGIPGAVDARTGVVRHALNLGIERLDVATVLGARLGVPVHVENDVNAAALGAFHVLGEDTTPGGTGGSMAYLNLGTGLAAGIVVDGRLWRGARGAAGEIGHVVVDPTGPLDLDGQPGGLEVMASGSGIARQWGVAGVDASAVFDAADAGDARAVDIRRRLVEGVAAAVRVLVLTVDVETVVIGGGLARLGDRLLPAVDTVLAGWAAASPFLASLGLADRVHVLDGDIPVAALGAALWNGE